MFKRVLVIAAHPDDLELSCGGTVAKLSSMGAEVHALIMVSGVDHMKYVDISSEILRYNSIAYSYGKDRFVVNQHAVSDIDAYILSVSPELIITHWEEDSHQDHRACNELVSIARRRQPISVWHMSSYPYNLKYNKFSPDIYVDISNFVDLKYEAIKAFKNVSSWADSVMSHDRWRGSFINAYAAEVFHADSLVI